MKARLVGLLALFIAAFGAALNLAAALTTGHWYSWAAMAACLAAAAFDFRLLRRTA